jgi:glycosyltransferase involved in cell wall biosynthesis
MNKSFNLNCKCIYNPLNKSEILQKSKEKINLSFFEKKRRELKIINVSRFTEQKDHITILKSAEILKRKKIQFKLLLIGNGYEKLKMKKFIKDKKLEKFVKIIRFQKNPYQFINKSDVFILSSKYEGLPNVLLEAAVLKKFIISTNCQTGPKEILLNGKGGFLFKIGDYKDLANKIIRFKKNKKKYFNKVRISYKALDRFNYKSNIKKYFYLVKKYV